MRVGVTTLAAGAMVALAIAFPGGAAADALGYCDPASTQFDPVDVPKEGSTPVIVPGVHQRDIVLAGVKTRVLEAGNSETGTAVVFLSPGGSGDWARMLPLVANDQARAIAFDLPGYGQAEPTWGMGRDLDTTTSYLDRALDELGVEQVHLVAHDIGGPPALEWASRHPDRLRSVALIDTGALLGYRHHQLAQISRTPEFGELFWAQMTRASWNVGIQQGQSPTRPLPLDYTNRLYDDFDRETRCGIIALYRAAEESEVDAAAQRQAEVLVRRPDRPALVIWGANDPYLPAEMAHRQREAFPSARIEIFEDSGHWPFADNPDRTRELVVPFILEAVTSDQPG
jgi:pimeloyl-ACP methyl ester carboxylesterase